MEGSLNLGDEIPRDIHGWLTATMAAIPWESSTFLPKLNSGVIAFYLKKER
jgi:hypothetical protein